MKHYSFMTTDPIYTTLDGIANDSIHYMDMTPDYWELSNSTIDRSEYNPFYDRFRMKIKESQVL